MATSSDFSRSCFIGSDEVKVIFCEPCEQAGNQVEAEGFCVDCSEYLCGQCLKKHKLFKAFRKHVLQDKDSMPQSVTEDRIKDVCVTKCDLHSDKVIEYYCLSCDVLGCTTCITLDHRQCEKVDHIPNIVKSTDVHGELKIFVNKVDQFSQHVQESTNALQTQTDVVNDMRKEAKATLKKERAELNNFFDDLEREMEDKIDKIHTSNTTTLTTASKTYDTIVKQLSDIKTEVSKKQNGGQKCETFISWKKSSLYIDAVDKESKVRQQESKILQYKFRLSPKIKTLMEQIKRIGSLETKTVELQIPAAKLQVPITTTKAPSKTQFTEEQTPYLSEVSTLKTKISKTFPVLSLDDEINVSTGNEKNKPDVTGIAMLQELFIVLADQRNNAVKVIDIRNRKVTSELKIETRVWSVTKVDENTVVIGTDTSIQLLSVSKHGLLSTNKVLDTIKACIGAEYSQGRLIIAACYSISIFNIQGRALRKIATDSKGEMLFGSCYDVAISEDQETIYVSDCTKNVVICMTIEGKVKATYRDSDLKSPWGIAVDKEGYVYVCSSGNDSIHQLSGDCTKLQVFKNIRGFCITCTNTNKLIVGSGDSVKLYELM